MTTQDYIKSVLATFMWNERDEDSLVGMEAKGIVIANRVRAGWFGGDWIRVIENSDAVSANVPPLKTLGDPRDPLFQKVLWKVDAIFLNMVVDCTAGGLYYADLTRIDQRADRAWFQKNILDKLEFHPRTGSVGRTTFFR